MKKKKIIISLLLILFLSISIYYIGSSLAKPSEKEIEDAQKYINIYFTTPENELPEGLRLNLRGKFPDDLKEENMQSVLHEMSHQKVKADVKWGEILITQERIHRLLEVAKLNETTYKNGDIYIEILEKWRKGDFSSADIDHNTIWTLQDGTIGEAEGLLSPVEEMKYIEEIL